MQTIEEYIENYNQLLAPVEEKYPDLKDLISDYSREKYPSLFNDSGVIYSEDRKCLLFANKVFLPTDEYHVPEGTEIIYEGAFAHTNIHSIVLPQSLRVIGACAFKGCRRLESVFLPENVEYIGYAAFDGEYIDHVDVAEHNNHIQIVDIDGMKSYESQSFKALMICEGKFLFYLKTVNNGVPCFPQLSMVEYWGAKATIEGDGRPMEIDLPTSVKIIGPYSFENCTFLRHVNFKDLVSLEEIGDDAFSGCFELNEVNLCDSVISIGKFAFCNCTSLTRLETPASLQEIGAYSFLCCYRLNDIKLNEGLIEIGECAFHNCEDIDRVKVSSNLKDIYRAFDWNTHLKSIAYSENLPVPLVAFRMSDNVSGDMSQYSFEYGGDMVLSKDRKVLLGYFGRETDVLIPDDVEELGPEIDIQTETVFTLNKRVKRLDRPMFCHAIKLCQEIEIDDSFFGLDEETAECIGSELWIPKNLHDFAERLRNKYPLWTIREI